jgi:hypothetical protein
MPRPEDYAANKLNQIEAGKDSSKPGPKSPEGKKRTSMNALRHGLSGRVVVLPTEDLSLYRQFCEDFVASLNPETPLEGELAQNVADGYWRLKRVRTTEESLFALGHDEGQGDFDAANEEIHAAYTAGKTFRDNSKAFVNLSLYEQRINRGIEKNMKQLRELQAERIERRKAEMAELLRLRDLDKSKSSPDVPAWVRSSTGLLIPAMFRQGEEPVVDGFVYSTEEIEVEAHRRAADEVTVKDTNVTQFPKRAA